MSLYCWWFGCEQHEWDPTPPDEATCQRCGEHVTYADMIGETRHRWFMDWLIGIWRFILPRKCPDCGRRYRDCDETVDHIPF